MKEIITKLESLKTEVDSLLKYIEYQESLPKLSKLEKRHLAEDLKYMSLASNHTYTHIKYIKGLDCSYVAFYYISKRTGEKRFDRIGGSPYYTQKMQTMRAYKIVDLLR